MTKTKYTEIAGLKEIAAEQRAKFEELDSNINGLENRSKELKAALPKKGLHSVASVQESVALKTEQEYLHTALETNKATRKAMIEEEQALLTNTVRNALIEHADNVRAAYRTELKEKIAAKQAEIAAIHKEALAHNQAEYDLLISGLTEMQPYLTQKDAKLIQDTLYIYAEAVPENIQAIMQ